MTFVAIVEHKDGRRAILTQAQLSLLPHLLRYTRRGALGAALVDACARQGCPIDFDAQREPEKQS